MKNKDLNSRSPICNTFVPNAFKGKKHTLETKKIIGEKSKEKFTKEYYEKIKNRCKGNKKRAINGYILIKDYTHPNRNSHDDVLEHIRVMSEYLGRAIKKVRCYI